MARIRTIKPEFWTSEQVVECSTNARLLFIGLWNFADDAGILEDSEKQIKMRVFPGDDITSDSIRRMIDELSKNALIEQYEVKNRLYIRICGWHHQKIDKPSYKYPLPNGVIPTSKQEYDENHSSNARRAPPPGREWKGITDTSYQTPDGVNVKSHDPVKEIFDIGVGIITKCGKSETQARSLIGKLRKAKGDLEAFSVLKAARDKTDAAAFIAKSCETVTDRYRNKQGVSV